MAVLDPIGLFLFQVEVRLLLNEQVDASRGNRFISVYFKIKLFADKFSLKNEGRKIYVMSSFNDLKSMHNG